MQALLEGVKITRVSNAVAAGTTVVNCSSVDMLGFEGVLFVVLAGTLTANQVTDLKAQQSSDDASSDDFTDLVGQPGPMDDDDDNQALALNVHRPMKRYVRPVVERATANAVIDGVIAIQYGPDNKPTVQDVATVAGSLTIVEPDESA